MFMTWRYILSDPSNGAWNMAFDEAILKLAAEKKVPPTLRLYSWNPACLSLGYAQSFHEVDSEKLNEKGWGLVRRPTGGRAILHTDELTYSVMIPLDSPIVAGGVLESYRRISGALMSALNSLGAQVNADKEYNNLTHSEKAKPVCFEVPSNYEITANGKKLIGSAQARKLGGVLQHGSLPLFGDITRITDVLLFNNEAERIITKERVLAHATTLAEIVNREISWQEAANAFIRGFESTLNILFYQSDVTQDELSLAQELFETKYNSSKWNQRA